MKLLSVLAGFVLAAVVSSHAQAQTNSAALPCPSGSVTQMGSVTPGNVPVWEKGCVIGDSGITPGGGGGGSGTVTTTSVTTANGFNGTVATPTTTPAITIGTTVSGMVKGSGGAAVPAIDGTDYISPADLATTSTAGLVKPDGSTITVTGGVISAPGGGLSPIASGNVLGNVSGSSATPAAVPISTVSTPYYLPANGINCDGAEIGALVTTAGSPTVSSLTYTFTQADVGRVIGIYDAGAQSVTATTTNATNTISAVTGSAPRFAGEQISGTNITTGTKILSQGGLTALTMRNPATASGSAVSIVFHPPQAFTISSVTGGVATLSGNVGTTITNAQGVASIGTVSFTGSMAGGTTLTVTSVTGVIAPGMVIESVSGATSAMPLYPRPYVVQQLTGTSGGAGTYQMSVANTAASGTIFTVDPQTGGYATFTTVSSGTIQAGSYLTGFSYAGDPFQIVPGGTATGGTGTYALSRGITVASGTVYAGARARKGTDVSSKLASLVSTVSSSGGGTIKLSDAACVVSSTTYMASNVSWAGDGADSSAVWWISTSDNTTGTFATPSTASLAAPISNWSMHDFSIDMSLATLSTWNISAKACQCNYTSNVDVYNLDVFDSSATSIAFDYSNGLKAHHNYVVRPGRYGSGQAGSSGIGNGTAYNGSRMINILTDNIIIDPMNYGIFSESQTSTIQVDDLEVVGHNIIYYTYAGPNTVADGDAPAAIGHAGYGGVIDGNTIYVESPSQLVGGVYVTYGSFGSNQAGSDTVVSNNNMTGMLRCFYADYTYPSSNFPSWTLGNFLVANNKCKGQGSLSTNTASDGIRFVSNASVAMKHIKLIGNKVEDFGRCGVVFSGAGGFSGVDMEGNTTINNGRNPGSTIYAAGTCIISNVAKLDIGGMNVAYDDSAATQKYAVAVESGFGVTSGDIDGNDFTGNATSPFLFAGTYTGIIRNTAGYNPQGCAAVTVTASPMTYTAGYSPGYLSVSGGTVTSITQGGVTTGQTSGIFPQSPNEADTIITYTTAPTLMQCQQ